MDRMLAIGASRTRLGAALASDVAPLERLRAETAGELPLLDLAVRNALRRIAVLTGEDPVAGARGFTVGRARAPATPQALTVQDPRQLLRLRPDVQIAEARLIAAFERAGASRAALYPSLSLGAGAGLLAAPGALDEAGAFRFSIGPSINWGIFNLGQVRARIRASDATSEAAAAQWQGSLLVALEEADGAIDAWRSARSASASAEAARNAAARAAATVRARARAGAASTFELAEAEADLLAAEANVIAAEANQREAWANVHLALGAGWTPDQ
jgi:outer membrane protein TolC